MRREPLYGIELKIILFAIGFGLGAEGGNRNAPNAQWRPKFLFEDSPTCVNFDEAKDLRLCRDYVMTTLVSGNP